MKKIFLTVIASAIYFLSYSQSFHKNSLVFDAKLGIDIYNTKYYYQLKSSGQDTTTEDKAANRNFSFGLEYGVLDRLGIGVRAKFNRYFAEADKTTGKDPYHTSLDYMATVNFHAVKNKVLDLALGFNIGGSKLNLVFNDISETEVYGSGLYFDLHLTPKIYIKRFAFQFDLGMPFVKYNNLTTNYVNFNNEVLAKWSGLGYNFGIGVAFRFLKPKESTSSNTKTTN